MTRLPALAALVLLLGAAVPGAVAAPDAAPAADRTVTVRGSCVGSGRVVLREVIRPERATVTVRGRDVANGRWVGEHLLTVGVDDTVDTPVSVRAQGRRFARTFEADGAGTGTEGVLELKHRGGGRCSLGYSRDAGLVVVADRRVSAFVGKVGSTELIARAEVRCDKGTRWRLSLTATTGPAGTGFGHTTLQQCRRGRLTVRGSTTGAPAALPDTLVVLAKRADGRTKRLRYETSTTPAGAGAPR